MLNLLICKSKLDYMFFLDCSSKLYQWLLSFRDLLCFVSVNKLCLDYLHLFYNPYFMCIRLLSQWILLSDLQFCFLSFCDVLIIKPSSLMYFWILSQQPKLYPMLSN